MLDWQVYPNAALRRPTLKSDKWTLAWLENCPTIWLFILAIYSADTNQEFFFANNFVAEQEFGKKPLARVWLFECRLIRCKLVIFKLTSSV